ncbi:hypothetical protein [Streptomyces aureus]|uniref:Uncharacterized protein n=1 Tax=Streptomyces aureus TaxID=193461 RepID=A0ABV4T2D6_9ACTN
MGSARADAAVVAPENGVPLLFTEARRPGAADAAHPLERPQAQRNVSLAVPPVLLVFHQIGARPARTQMQKVALFARERWRGRWDSDGAFHTYEQKILIVATTLELLCEQGPHGKIFWRFNRRYLQTLWDVIGNPRMDAALERRREEQQARQEVHQAERNRLAAQQAAEHEARRPVCTVCGAKFPDDRWKIVQRYPRPSNGWRPHLCEFSEAAALQEEAERERQGAAAHARAEAEANKPRGLFGRRVAADVLRDLHRAGASICSVCCYMRRRICAPALSTVVRL